MNVLLKSLLFVLLLTAPFILTSEAMAYNWFVLEGHSYALTETGAGWEEAQTEAQSLGANLVTINSVGENDWLKSTFQGNSDMLWIGFYQPPGSVEPDGGWQWINGDAVIYTNWLTGEPNNEPPEENYGVMLFNNENGGKWNDYGNTRPEYQSTLGIMESTIPIPPTMLLLGSGLLGLVGWRRFLKI